MSRDFTEEIRQVIEADRSSDTITEITSRACDSDRYSGVQYKVYGRIVPVRPVISLFAEVDGHAIESLYHCTDGEPHLGFFVADLPEQPHPAFV